MFRDNIVVSVELSHLLRVLLFFRTSVFMDTNIFTTRERRKKTLRSEELKRHGISLRKLQHKKTPQLRLDL